MTRLDAHPPPLTRVFAPAVWLGAPAPGGLALPSASPAADTLYAPRGVWFDDDRLIACDSGNHRVLIWHGVPSRDHAPADIVLGQPSMSDEGPKLLHLPTAVAVVDGRLIVADAWHHRLLIWSTIPGESDTPPDVVIGQPGLDQTEPNRGRGTTERDGFYWPYGFGVVSGRFMVTDTGNRRVLVWPNVPESDEPPHWLIGQRDWNGRGENADGEVGPLTFRWPHAVAGDGRALYIADAGNHRVLGWRDVDAACGGAEPDLVLGQPHLRSNGEWPYGPQSPEMLRFPYDIAAHEGELAISDTANNRILIHRAEPGRLVGRRALAVLAQPDFEANGENRWDAVKRDTLCWPYGLHLRGDTLAVADSGNNRITIWKRQPPQEN